MIRELKEKTESYHADSLGRNVATAETTDTRKRYDLEQEVDLLNL